MALPSEGLLSSGIKIFFKLKDCIYPAFAKENESILEVAHRNKIELEGACEGSLACSTCHVILSKNLYDRLEEPSDREYDLLDQAYRPTSTSRLGCQVKIKDWMKDAVFIVPTATRNFAVDGYKPKHH